MAEGVVAVLVLVVLLGAVAGQTTKAPTQTTLAQYVTTESNFEGSSAKQDLSGDRLNNASTGSTPAKCTTGRSRSENSASDGCIGDTSDDSHNNTDGIAVKCNEEDGNVTICKTTNSKRISLMSMGSLSKANYVIGENICRYMFFPLLTSAVVFNTFNLLVYTDPAMRSPTSSYLIALATDELLFAGLSIVRQVIRLVYGTEAFKRQAYLYFALFGSNFCLASLRVLMYCFTVLVSTERFLAVAFPLKSRNFRLIKSPIIFIISVTIICCSCHIPTAFKYNVVPKPNTTDYTLAPSAMYINYKSLFIGLALFNRILYTYIVLVCGLIMNLCVLLALRIHSKNRAKMNTTVDAEKTAKRERQTTITILTSTFLFTVLAIPLATDALVQTFLADYNMYRKEHYVNMLMKDVNNLLIMFSLSTDFVFYITLSKAYRRTFFRRLPFMATMCRRQKYVQKSFGTQSQTQVTETSGVGA